MKQKKTPYKKDEGCDSVLYNCVCSADIWSFQKQRQSHSWWARVPLVGEQGMCI